MSALDDLRAELSKVPVVAHPRVRDGKVEWVDAHMRDLGYTKRQDLLDAMHAPAEGQPENRYAAVDRRNENDLTPGERAVLKAVQSRVGVRKLAELKATIAKRGFKPDRRTAGYLKSDRATRIHGDRARERGAVKRARTRVPGLLTERQGTGYLLVHESSGKPLSSHPFATKEIANGVADRLGEIADWTQSEQELAKPEVAQRVLDAFVDAPDPEREKYAAAQARIPKRGDLKGSSATHFPNDPDLQRTHEEIVARNEEMLARQRAKIEEAQKTSPAEEKPSGVEGPPDPGPIRAKLGDHFIRTPVEIPQAALDSMSEMGVRLGIFGHDETKDTSIFGMNDAHYRPFTREVSVMHHPDAKPGWVYGALAHEVGHHIAGTTDSGDEHTEEEAWARGFEWADKVGLPIDEDSKTLADMAIRIGHFDEGAPSGVEGPPDTPNAPEGAWSGVDDTTLLALRDHLRKLVENPEHLSDPFDARARSQRNENARRERGSLEDVEAEVKRRGLESSSGVQAPTRFRGYSVGHDPGGWYVRDASHREVFRGDTEEAATAEAERLGQRVSESGAPPDAELDLHVDALNSKATGPPEGVPYRRIDGVSAEDYVAQTEIREAKLGYSQLAEPDQSFLRTSFDQAARMVQLRLASYGLQVDEWTRDGPILKVARTSPLPDQTQVTSRATQERLDVLQQRRDAFNAEMIRKYGASNSPYMTPEERRKDESIRRQMDVLDRMAS